jgi:hypothetical protein
MEAKIKHLEFILATINRLANNSFLLKGWTVTLVGGLLALSFKEIDHRYLYISLIVLAIFWLLDSYYLSRERNFVNLYNQVRNKPDEAIDFSMDAIGLGSKWGWLGSAFSKTLLLFYGGLLAINLIINYFL